MWNPGTEREVCNAPREGFTEEYLKVNEVAYPLYFSTSRCTYPVPPSAAAEGVRSAGPRVARRRPVQVDVPRNRRTGGGGKHVSKLSIIALTRRPIVIHGSGGREGGKEGD